MRKSMLHMFILAAALGFWACGDGGNGKDVGEDDGLDVPADEADTTPDVPEDETTDLVEEEPGEDLEEDTVVDVEPETEEDVPTDVTPADGIVGDPCADEVQCGGIPGENKQCLTDIMGFITFEGGYCTAVCTSPDECGDGANCVDVYIGSYCLQECDDPSDCRTDEHYTCDRIPIGSDPNTYCIPEFGGMEGTDY